MKYLRVLLIIAILVIALGGVQGNVSAQYKFSYLSTINVQNLSGNPATVVFTYYHGTGSNGTAGDIATTADVTLAAYEFKAVTTLPVTSGFKGSVVLSSDQPIAAVSNIHGNNMLANASYIGSTGGATSVNIPLLMKGNYGYDTWFNVQNAGTGDAAVTVNYSDGTTANATIKQGASQTFNQATETHGTGTKQVFSAKVTSPQPLVVSVVEESAKVLFAYSGFGTASKNPVMPLINENNYGYTSSIQIQNVGTQDTEVTVSYTPSGTNTGKACSEKQTVPQGQSKTFVTEVFSATGTGTSDCEKGKTFVGSAAVTVNSTNQDLVAVVNQHKLPVNGEAYGGFDVSAATPKVVLPLLMDRNYSWWTSANVMNVGDSTVDIHCDLTNTTVKIDQANVAKNQLMNKNQVNVVGDKWVGSATCYAYKPGTTTIDTTAKIVGVVNELLTGPNDTFMVYEGINVAP